MKKIVKWAAIALPVLGVIAGVGYAVAPPVDIRPEALLKAGITPESEARGRALLAALPARYGGLERYRAKRHTRVRMTDDWPSAIMKAAACPWKDGETLELTFGNVSDNSRLVFRGGPRDGHAWGIQQWVTYTQDAAGKRTFAPNSDIKFWLPTIEYFVELPFRIGEGDVVAHAGETELDGETQDLVFVSWGTAEPQAHVDQYVLWINRKTGLVDYVAYTVRDMGKVMAGGMRYQDFRETDGITLPFRMTAGSPDGSDVAHRFELSSVEFLSSPEVALIPEPSRRAAK